MKVRRYAQSEGIEMTVAVFDTRPLRRRRGFAKADVHRAAIAREKKELPLGRHMWNDEGTAAVGDRRIVDGRRGKHRPHARPGRRARWILSAPERECIGGE